MKGLPPCGQWRDDNTLYKNIWGQDNKKTISLTGSIKVVVKSSGAGALCCLLKCSTKETYRAQREGQLRKRGRIYYKIYTTAANQTILIQLIVADIQLKLWMVSPMQTLFSIKYLWTEKNKHLKTKSQWTDAITPSYKHDWQTRQMFLSCKY